MKVAAPAPKISAWGVLFRIIGGSFRWLIAGLTAWYKDGDLRGQAERAERWSPRDRIERYWSVVFYALLLLWGSSIDLALPWVEDPFWARALGVVALTLGGVFVSIITARRIVVAVTHDPWTAQEMWTDKLHLMAILLVVVTTPVAIFDRNLPVPSEWVVAGFPLITGAISGAWASSVILVDHRSKRMLLSAVRAAFAGSEAEWARSRFVARGKVVTVRHAPAAAFSDLRASEQKLSQVAPDWQIDDNPERTSASGARLTLVRTTDETRASRTVIERSEGLVIGVSDHYHPGAVRYALAPGTTPSQFPRVDALAMQESLRVVEWNPAAGFAIAAPLDRATAELRDAFAAYSSAQPHEIEIDVTFDEEKRPETITVTRYPRSSANLDRLKRLSLWNDINTSTVVPVEGTRWIIKDQIESGTISMRRIEDILATGFSLDDLHERFPAQDTDPATSWRGFPVAIREDGQAVQYTTFHTLCVGQTGAGKGSVVWGILQGVLPAARAGYARLYAIDPKGAEAFANGKPRAMFERVATNPDDWEELVDEVAAELESRKGVGRKLDVRDYPLIILFIDELSAVSVLDDNAQRARDVMKKILRIASQGRSMNILLLAAVQAPQKDMVGQLRQFLGMRIALRTETSIETNLTLGDGAHESGARASLIPVASDGNGYATAGIGYMRVEGEIDPVRVRFPYTDDATLDRWDAEFRELRESGALKVVERKEVDPFVDPFADDEVDHFGDNEPAQKPFAADDDPFADAPVAGEEVAFDLDAIEAESAPDAPLDDFVTE